MIVVGGAASVLKLNGANTDKKGDAKPILVLGVALDWGQAATSGLVVKISSSVAHVSSTSGSTSVATSPSCCCWSG